MIKMPMIGHGTRVSADVKRGSTMPFSVQANYIWISHYFHPPSVGSIRDTHLNHTVVKTTVNHTIGNIVPYGGKFLYIKIYAKRTYTATGYIVPLINGVEQEDLKVSYTNTTAGEEWVIKAEVDFNAYDRLAIRWKPETGTAPNSDTFNMVLAMGYNIGETSA